MQDLEPVFEFGQDDDDNRSEADGMNGNAGSDDGHSGFVTTNNTVGF